MPATRASPSVGSTNVREKWTGVGLLREAFDEGWRFDSASDMWLWIPYLSLPVGVTLLALQFVANLLGYLGGREPPHDTGDMEGAAP